MPMKRMKRIQFLCKHHSNPTVLYCASHKNWIRIIRFIGMHRPLSQ